MTVSPISLWYTRDPVKFIALLHDLSLDQRPAVVHILESLHLLEQFRLQCFLREVLFVQDTVQHLRLLAQLVQLPLERIEDLEIHHALLFLAFRFCQTLVQLKHREIVHRSLVAIGVVASDIIRVAVAQRGR